MRVVPPRGSWIKRIVSRCRCCDKPPPIMKFPLDAVSKNRSGCLDKENEKDLRFSTMRTFARPKISTD